MRRFATSALAVLLTMTIITGAHAQSDIAFKGAGGKLPTYARETGVDAVGVDETQDPDWVHANLPDDMPVQGNLDPLLLLAGGERLTTRIHSILDAFAGRPHVFNLGHGIGQHTPIAHVEQLVEAVRGWNP